MFFFGVNTGRVGSFHLSKIINSEKNFICLHEGKEIPKNLIKVNKKKQKTMLRHLADYNFPCYVNNKKLRSMIIKYRKKPTLKFKKKRIGDIAYYNAVFLPELIKIFRNAKFIFQIRNFKDFVKSCVSSNNDFAPVGWKDAKLSKTKIEKYLDLMRLKPKKRIKNFPEWEKWDSISKNMWLWHETNRLILKHYTKHKDRFFVLKTEDFKEDPINNYSRLRKFLGIKHKLSKYTLRILNKKKINDRPKKQKVKFEKPITSLQKKVWKKFVIKTSKKLGYSL